MPADEAVQAPPGFAEEDVDTARSHFLGLPKGTTWDDYTSKWPWSASLLQAVVAWAATLRWLPVATNLPTCSEHQGTSWAELLLDFELVTGLDMPSFHRE